MKVATKKRLASERQEQETCERQGVRDAFNNTYDAEQMDQYCLEIADSNK